MLAGLSSLQKLYGQILPCLCRGQWLPAIPWCSLACQSITPTCASVFTGPTFLSVSKSPSSYKNRVSLVGQMVKRLPTMWETWVRSLGWEDPLEKEMATHSSILAWKIPWTEDPGRLQSMGSQRVGCDFASLTRIPVDSWIRAHLNLE